MRTETIEKTYFTFAELDDSAKDNAREWFRQNLEMDIECVFEDAATVAELMGLDIRQTLKKTITGKTHYAPTIYYSGFSSQGDGACFEGRYTYKKGALKAVKEYAPQDETLQRIAKDLQDAQRKVFYSAAATVKHRGHYYHEGCMAIDVDMDSRIGQATFTEAENAIIEAFRDFARWIYRQLEREWDHMNSNETVDETIVANGYEFDENGNFLA